jgi:hypothetical protein
MIAGRIHSLVFASLAMASFACAQVADNKPADTNKIGVTRPEKTDKHHPPRSVIGAIEDKDGNPVTGAMVYLKDMQTGKERAIAATPEGKYRFDDLNKAVDYQITAVKGKAKSAPKLLSNFDTRRLPVMNLTIEGLPVSAAK